MSKFRVLIGFLISLFFIYLIIWKPQLSAFLNGSVTVRDALFGVPRIDLVAMWSHVQSAKLFFVLITFLITPLHMLIRSHRWQLMIEPIGKIRLLDSYSIQTIGNLANTVFPMRLGEVAKAGLLTRRTKLPLSSSIASVVLERLLDVTFLLGIFGVAAVFYKFPENIAQTFNTAILIFGIGVIAGFAIIITLVFSKDPIKGSIGLLVHLLPAKMAKTVEKLIRDFVSGFAMIRSSKHLLLIIFESLLLWVIYGLQNWMMIVAFGFNVDYPLISANPFLTVVVLLAVLAAGLSIPSAPGGIGTFHAAVILAMSLFGIHAEVAMGFAVVIHALSILFYCAAGVGFLWHEGLSMSELNEIGNSNQSEQANK